MGNKSSLMLQDEEIKQISDETGFSPLQIEKLYTRFAHLDRANCGSLNRNDLLSIPELAINPLCDRLIQMFFSSGNSDVQTSANNLEEERINFRQFMKVLATFKSTSSSSNNLVSQRNNKSSLIQTQDSTEKGSNDDGRRESNNKNFGINRLVRGNSNKDQASNDGLNTSKTTNRSNEGIKNKLLFVFKIYDADNDGRISFQDLKSILKLMVGNYIENVQLDRIASRAFMEVDEDNDGYIEFDEFCKVFSGKDLDDKLRVKFFN